jgi:hypothetical protein
MFEIISQLENAAQVADDYARDSGQMMFDKEDTVEWKAALLLRNYHEAINMVIDNTEFKDEGVMITYRHYALFLEVINRLTYGQ